MSSVPDTNARLIAELYGWPWADAYDRDEWEPAIEAVMDDELNAFCEEMRYLHRDTDQGYGPQSWRDFRNFAVYEYFADEFDMDRLYYEIEGRIRSAHE